jgi:hypothetical protein
MQSTLAPPSTCANSTCDKSFLPKPLATFVINSEHHNSIWRVQTDNFRNRFNKCSYQRLDIFRGNTTALGTVHRLRNIYNISHLNLFQTLGTNRSRCEDNIKILLKSSGGGGLDWMALAHNRDEWQDMVSAVVQRGFHKMLGNS